MIQLVIIFKIDTDKCSGYWTNSIPKSEDGNKTMAMMKKIPKMNGKNIPETNRSITVPFFLKHMKYVAIPIYIYLIIPSIFETANHLAAINAAPSEWARYEVKKMQT